ncbi:hypothetical protein HNR42_000314 [Deinobacterium chartae]|uniref:Transglycosylase SLT domain-containing protein n=1 Tax=Deinobacterium chartae TaxID=521158 RepID=A0A841HYA8_9DEIO|nr:hypothetical protein [Deinobacterium chartae]MBB6096902.1 hypothetical protein [Deinobacterium chartae]
MRRSTQLATLTVAALLSFSPSVAGYLSQTYQRYSLGHSDLSPAAVEAALEAQGPALGPPSAPLLDRYTARLEEYTQALDALEVSGARRVRLLERYWQVYWQAYELLGAAQASALVRMLATETRNQAPELGRHSAFASPETALASSLRWLEFIRWVSALPPGSPDLEQVLSARSPVRLAPGAVLGNARWIMRAANATRLPHGVLAAIVDNEQAGSQQVYGIAGAMRSFADTVAWRTAQVYGSSGLSGRISQTVGLAQMSWKDALGQRERFEALGIRLGVPFPETEAQARALLVRPYANLVFTGSRLRGYLNALSDDDPLSMRPHASAWTYFVGPAWHNNPALASSGETFAYAWNGFFKAALYQRLIPAYLRAEQGPVAQAQRSLPGYSSAATSSSAGG